MWIRPIFAIVRLSSDDSVSGHGARHDLRAAHWPGLVGCVSEARSIRALAFAMVLTVVPGKRSARDGTTQLNSGRPTLRRSAPSIPATWLILPVVICLSQRLSHACVGITCIPVNCEWLGKSVIVYLIVHPTRITVVILELIRA